MKKTPPTPVKLLDDAEIEKWLVEHIPHRVSAALAGCQDMNGEWAMPALPTIYGDPFHGKCVIRAAAEGKRTAIRWLIELLDIQGDLLGKPGRPRKSTSGTDVWMERFGAPSFDLNHLDASKLAKVWKGCCHSTSHPTSDTNHFPVFEPQLNEAVRIIVEYLQIHLYGPAGRSLSTTVRAL